MEGTLLDGTRRESSPEEVAEAIRFLADRPLVILGGAGLSTDSGIPDYRGPRPAGTPPVRMPMTYQEFVATDAAQRRYWARAHVGWGRMGTARPNDGHRTLARLEVAGRVEHLITQNVDGLHESAGQRSLTALHGQVSEVVCLDCRRIVGRAGVQARMTADNPGFAEEYAAAPVRPDGDVELDRTDHFVVPRCEECTGRLKPHVVFFGENVPRERVERAQQAVEAADVLLVLGSSLSVMSGLRFVRQALRRELPVVVVNRGATRADPMPVLKLDTGCTPFLLAWERTTALAAQPA